MPRVEFDEANKVEKVSYDFERLKLAKDEKARLAVVESPQMEYRHTIDAPKIVNGQPETHMVENPRTKEKVEDYARSFISSPLCSGDPVKLADTGIDAENCRVCAYAMEHSDRVKPPMRRYAMHVIRYKTKPGSFEIASPFSIELVVWAFTDRVFNKLTDLKKEWADNGGFKAHDLTITCTNGTFQNYEFGMSPDAAFAKDNETKALTKETYENNQIPDLALACGSRKEENWIVDDLKKVTEAWDAVNGSQDVDSSDSASLDEGISGLMGDDEAPAVAEESETKKDSSGETTSFDDLFS